MNSQSNHNITSWWLLFLPLWLGPTGRWLYSRVFSSSRNRFHYRPAFFNISVTMATEEYALFEFGKYGRNNKIGFYTIFKKMFTKNVIPCPFFIGCYYIALIFCFASLYYLACLPSVLFVNGIVWIACVRVRILRDGTTSINSYFNPMQPSNYPCWYNVVVFVQFQRTQTKQ